MATYTEHYNLKKPDTTDYVNIQDLNGNADIIDAALAGKAETTDVSAKYTKPATGIPATDLAADVQTSLGKADTAIQASEKGAVNGVATLDGAGKVPASQLPSYVDDVIEGYYYNGAFYSDSAHTEQITPETGIIYVDLDTDDTYRWSGSVYVRINDITVDSELSETSTNPVQNKVITAALTEKAPVVYDTASGSIASFDDGADDMPIKSLVVNIEPVQAGSGDPSPTNIRPISGWTGCEVTRAGKNLANFVCNKGLNENGEITNHNGRAATVDPIYIDENKSYIARIGADVKIILCVYDGFGKLLRREANIYPDTTLNTTGGKYFRCALYTSSEGVDVSGAEKMITDSNDDTSYEPYKGATYPISWQTEAGTVYGATMNGITGELMVNTVAVDMGTLNWRVNGTPGSISGNTEYVVSNLNKAYGETNMYCSIFKVANQTELNAIRGRAASASISVIRTEKNVQDFIAFVSGQMLVYELATPITYNLTPQQITTLLGTNNVWADCGPVSVDYPADTKLYIQKINAPTDDDMTADTQIASGKYFLIGNTLYLSTTIIPAGDTIIPGTNCTKTNLAAALNALNT